MTKQLIQTHPSIMMGKPTIVGTRITVELIREKLAAGESIEQILDAHPRLTKEGILAAIDFAEGNDWQLGDIAELAAEDRDRATEDAQPDREFMLKDLLMGVTKKNRHPEVDFGHPVGKEKL